MTVLLAAVSSLVLLLLAAAGLADETRRDAVTACWFQARYAVTAGEFAHGAILAAVALTICALAAAACLSARLAVFACALTTATTFRITHMETTTDG